VFDAFSQTNFALASSSSQSGVYRRAALSTGAMRGIRLYAVDQGAFGAILRDWKWCRRPTCANGQATALGNIKELKGRPLWGWPQGDPPPYVRADDGRLNGEYLSKKRSRTRCTAGRPRGAFSATSLDDRQCETNQRTARRSSHHPAAAVQNFFARAIGPSLIRTWVCHVALRPSCRSGAGGQSAIHRPWTPCRHPRLGLRISACTDQSMACFCGPADTGAAAIALRSRHPGMKAGGCRQA